MAHDLTEIASEFAHEPYTRQVLETVPPNAGESLADVVRFRWGIDIEALLSVLNAGNNSPFLHRLLSSLISGPLDCDKLDYVRRDSTHLGVLFGAAIDHQRFVRNLTTIYQTRQENMPGVGVPRVIRKLELAEIGVAEKALVVAQSIWRTRKAMFSQVYWQHTARALKAMLGYVVRGILIATKAKGRDEEGAFWDGLRDLVFFPMPGPRAQGPAESRQIIASPNLSEVEATLLPESQNYPPSSCLSSTDDRVLHFLWNLAPSDSERQMIAAMRGRKLYLRLAVLSNSREAASYEVIYSQFRAHRSTGNHGAIEQARQNAEKIILALAEQALRNDDKLVPVGSSADAVAKEMKRARPLILVDVPIKDIPSTGQQLKKKNAIGYLPEDLSGVHSRKNPSFLGFSFSRADLDDSDFDRDVGKIRVFAHPQWRDLLARCLTDTQILGAVKDGFLGAR